MPNENWGIGVSLKKIPLTGIAFAVVLFLALLYIDGRVSQRNEPARGDTSLNSSRGNIDAQKEKIKWSKRIDQIGAGDAYKEFKDAYAASNFGIQHTAAHIFGSLLYEKVGLEGITICDSTFAFGCFHSFFGTILADKGLEVIKALDRSCIEKYGPLGTGCQHGIGHGLMEYMGHNNLVKALDACGYTTQKIRKFGCTSGVFMEYNVPLTLGSVEAVTQPREFDLRRPYSPCPDVPDKFQESCYYELGQWWDKIFNSDYVKLGRLCDGVDNRVNRESCFLGVGNVAAPSSEYIVGETINKCRKMPNKRGELICRAGASWSFFASPEYKRLAPDVCKGLMPDNQFTCTKESDLIKLN